MKNMDYIVDINKSHNLKDLESWLRTEIGSEYDILDIEIITSEAGIPENYTIVSPWRWCSDNGLSNILPCYRVGFSREDDAILCKLHWG